MFGRGRFYMWKAGLWTSDDGATFSELSSANVLQQALEANGGKLLFGADVLFVLGLSSANATRGSGQVWYANLANLAGGAPPQWQSQGFLCGGGPCTAALYVPGNTAAPAPKVKSPV